MRGDISEQAVLRRSARRAFLAETILWGGSYLIFTALMLVLTHIDFLSFFMVIGNSVIGSLFFLLIVCTIIITTGAYQFCLRSFSGWKRHIVGIGWGILLIFGGILLEFNSTKRLDGILIFILASLFLMTLFFSPFVLTLHQTLKLKLFAWSSCLLTLGGVILPPTAIVIISVIRPWCDSFGINFFSGLTFEPNPASECFWNIIFLIAISSLFSGYILRGKLWADLTGQSYRKLWSKTVILLWGITISIWLAVLGLVFYEDFSLKAALNRAENVFGRPITLKALTEYYYEGEHPDTEIWSVLEAGNQKFEQRFAKFLIGEDHDLELSQAQIQQCLDIEKGLTAILQTNDAILSRPLPKYPRQFSGNRFGATDSSQIGPSHALVRQELWRIRLALLGRDKTSAVKSYRRIIALRDSLSPPVLLDQYLTWLGLDSSRLKALQMLLESGMLDDAELRLFQQELHESFAGYESFWKRALYGDLLEQLSMVDLTARIDDIFNRPTGLDLRSLYWVLPQFKYFFCYNEIELVKWYTQFFDTGTIRPSQAQAVIFFTPPITACPRRLMWGTTKNLAMQILIDLELYYREHGRYPDALPKDAPLDPYNDQPFHYMIGEKKFTFLKLREKNSDATGKDLLMSLPGMPESGIESDDTVEKMLPVVMVWSVGPNRRDDHGEAGYSQDDIAVMRRLSPSPGEIPSDSAVLK